MKLSDLKAGETVIIDGGFPCMPAGPAIVQEDEAGHLYIYCNGGNPTAQLAERHYLDSQEDEPNGDLVGISWPTIEVTSKMILAGREVILYRWGHLVGDPSTQLYDAVVAEIFAAMLAAQRS